MVFDEIPEASISELKAPNYENLLMASIQHSDGVIIASDDLSSSLTKYIESSKKPFLPFTPKENFNEVYTDFLKNTVLK